MTTAKWIAPEAIVDAVTTDLNSLGNGSLIVSTGTALDNETDLYQYIELELILASLTPTGTPYVNVYFFVTVDGTNYEDQVASNTAALLGTFPLSTGAGAKRVALRNLILPPLKGKFAVENQSGVAFAASGNHLKYRRTNEQAV